MRLALASRMDTTFEQIDEHGWDQTDDRAKHLTVQLRIWLYLVFLEFKHSRSTGRLLLLRQDDIDFLDRNADRLLTLPYSITDDERLVANLKLTFIERQIILKSRAFRREDPIELRVAYVHQMREVLVARHQVVDARMGQCDLLASYPSGADPWPDYSCQISLADFLDSSKSASSPLRVDHVSRRQCLWRDSTRT